MSAAEQGDNNAVLVGLQALLRKAMSSAQRAYRALTASSNFISQTNGADIPAAATCRWTGTAVTTRVGVTTRVMGQMAVITDIVDGTVQFALEKDGVVVGGVADVQSGHVDKLASCTLVWIDAVAIGAPHVYSILAIATGGTATVRCIATRAQIVVEERPAP